MIATNINTAVTLISIVLTAVSIELTLWAIRKAQKDQRKSRRAEPIGKSGKRKDYLLPAKKTGARRRSGKKPAEKNGRGKNRKSPAAMTAPRGEPDGARRSCWHG